MGLRATRERADPIPDVDLADPNPDLIGGHDRVLAGLRRDQPVFWHGDKSRPGFWSVTRHADATRVYRDTATFTATHGMTLDSLREDRDPASGMMVEVTDPPEHRRLRRAIGAFFADGAVAAMATDIDANVDAVVTGLRGRTGAVDVVAALAARIPTHAAGLLLGLPADDLDWITERTSKVFLADRVGGARPTDGTLRAQAEQANGELLSYFARLVRGSRRARTGSTPERGGLVRRLAAGTGNRAALTTGEVVLNSLNLAIAGTQTTRNLLANLVDAMARFPTMLPAVRADPDLTRGAVEEAVRWANPVRHVTRVATADTNIGGVPILAGDRVVVWHRCANRDERVFVDADEFDVGRHPNPHLGFASGVHSCPGSGLARTQARSTLRRFAEAFSAVTVDGRAERVPSNFLHGFLRLPVRLTDA